MTGELKTALYSAPLPASRQGPLYNAFSYPTKISPESVAVFIACHTKRGDRVLDVFGGSGTAGIAAILCERPTPRMLEMTKSLGISPDWGPRDAVVYEISVIGSLLARVMTCPPPPSEFELAAKRLVQRARLVAKNLYQTTGPDGEDGQVRYVIWSDVVRCPKCLIPTTYADVRIRFEPLRFVDQHKCGCGFSGHPDEWERETETFVDPWTKTTTTRRRRIPWRVYGRSLKGNWSRVANESDAAIESEVLDLPVPDASPITPLRWGDLHRTGYHQGMTYLHDLYTPRNFYALATLWEQIEHESAHLRDALRLLVLSYNASHSTLMTRVVLKKQSTDFVVTGAQSGVLYVSGLPVEKNVFSGVERKTGVFRQAFSLLHGAKSRVEVVTASSTRLDLADNSIDYVFTDPPFGGYIPYSEINQINELWLGHPTDPAEEAIISSAQNKDLIVYQQLLTSVFSEVSRVMKPKADGTIVFHSAHASVWQALNLSLLDAGLSVAHAGILDKTQASFKQVNGHIAVSGDPLLLVRKTSRLSSKSPPTIDELIKEVMNDADGPVPNSELSDERLYSRLVGAALVHGTPMTRDAKTFYASRAGGVYE
jgi:16S rRNA G966 N2-methylase RsmD